MLFNVDGLPGVADPNVLHSLSSLVAVGQHVVGERALLRLVLVLDGVSM